MHFGEWERPHVPTNLCTRASSAFHDLRVSLSADALDHLAQELDTGGFDGSFKVDLRPGATRFHYHQLIMYAASAEMAACGERIVRAVAGDALRHTSRGIDAPPRLTDAVRTDWHHLLLRGAWHRVPGEEQAYVRYEVPTAPSCGPTPRPEPLAPAAQ